MRFIVEFDTDNAAFQDEDEGLNLEAVHKLITKAHTRVRIMGQEFGELNDFNGNKVGHFKIDY